MVCAPLLLAFALPCCSAAFATALLFSRCLFSLTEEDIGVTHHDE